MTASELIDAPAIEGDDKNPPPAHTLAERHVIANLIAHLERAGFVLHSAFDGNERFTVATTKEALEVIFSVDEAWLFVRKLNTSATYSIFFVLGNAPDGTEVAADWAFPGEDVNGFVAAMDAFDFDRFAALPA